MAIILDHLSVYISYLVPVFVIIIITDIDFMSQIPKTFDLVFDFLTNSAMFRESVVYEEKYFHHIANIHFFSYSANNRLYFLIKFVCIVYVYLSSQHLEYIIIVCT